MAAQCRVCLIAAMDRLWFDHIILFSEPSSSPSVEPPPQSLLHSSKESSKIQEIYPHDDEIINQETEDLDQNETATDYDEHNEERPRRLKLNLVSTKGSRYYSSSPISSQKRSRNHTTLKKSASCKSLMDLELEEVKGFMDLGFIFRRENMTKRIIHIVPGLHRITNNNIGSFGVEDEDERPRKEMIITRPYLSEAWMMKPEYSPLLNMRIPAVSKAADMKKHLKYWAHTVVASAIHQES